MSTHLDVRVFAIQGPFRHWEPSRVSNLFSRSIYQHGLISSELPLRRYFVLAGGALLALLFAAGGIIPRPPPTENVNSGPQLPKIRIYSELKGPEAVVIDTSRPIPGPPPATPDVTRSAAAAPRPELVESIAELVPPSLKQTDAKEQSKVGPEPQPPSHVAKTRKRRPVSYARRPDVGPFDGAWTFDKQDTRVRESFAQLVPPQPRHRGTKRDAAWARSEQARRPQFGWFDSGW